MTREEAEAVLRMAKYMVMSNTAAARRYIRRLIELSTTHEGLRSCLDLLLEQCPEKRRAYFRRGLVYRNTRCDVCRLTRVCHVWMPSQQSEELWLFNLLEAEGLGWDMGCQHLGLSWCCAECWCPNPISWVRPDLTGEQREQYVAAWRPYRIALEKNRIVLDWEGWRLGK